MAPHCYAVNCSILGLRHKAVSYREDLSINVDEIVDAVSEETDDRLPETPV